MSDAEATSEQQATTNRRQKSLVLILAREFASNLAMPIYIADADETLVYFNESAEKIAGRSFAETGEMPVRHWTRMLLPRSADGSEVSREEMPGGIAYHRASAGPRIPSHHRPRRRRARGCDDRACRCSGPRASSTGSWSSSGRHRPRMRVKIWGCRGSLATPGRETLAHRREHDLRRDVGERDPRHLRRRHRAPRARPRARRRGVALDPHLPHPPPPRPHRGARVLRAVLRPAVARSASGARRPRRGR